MKKDAIGIHLRTRTEPRHLTGGESRRSGADGEQKGNVMNGRKTRIDARIQAYRDSDSQVYGLTGRGTLGMGHDRPDRPGLISTGELRRFYVGSRTAPHSEWAHETLEAAIAHARHLVGETDEYQYVVQVVKVVRPAPQPTIVDDV